MTAIAEPPVGADGLPSGTPLSRAEGLELLGEVHGSGYKEGASLVRRGDGQIVQLGPLMYGLLECIDGQRDLEQLTESMCECLGRCIESEQVARLAEKLGELGLLGGTESNAPPRRNPLLALRWKVLLTNPRATERITAPFQFLFRPWAMWPILAGFLAVVWFVLIHKGVASATAQVFDNPELLLLVFGLAVASAGFHEIGHASACRYGGGTPAGMGVGIYMVWPAFYTDVTDAYRLPKRDRLRVDLGGLYFNAVVAVVTMAVWLLLRVDALLLLIGLQVLQMVKQLSPVIRADGYHILSDATGVPDLYSHMGPTMRRLLPGHRHEPSALTGRARVLVTAWVLIIVPILLSLSITAVLVLPHLAATTWESASRIVSAIPGQLDHGKIVDFLASLLRLVALSLPVLGTTLISQKIVRMLFSKARSWSEGRPGRGAVVALAGAGICCALAWAWWPSGQYQPVRASDGGTLMDLGRVVVKPASAVRPVAHGQAVQLRPGKHLAIAMVPVDGASRKHPAFFVIKGGKGQKPVVIVSPTAPSPKGVPHASDQSSTSTPTTSAPAASPSSSSTPTPAPSGDSTASATQPVEVTAFPFKLPSAPRPQDSQALSVNTKDGSVKYVVAYSLVEVKGGAPVDEQNTAYAMASCDACTTVAVSFQLVLVIGTSNVIAPVNFAGALNYNCPACVTTAIADQIVVTLKSAPTEDLVQQLTAELQKLNAITALGASGTPDQIAQEVADVQHEIETELQDSGLLANQPGSTSTSSSPSSTGTSTTPASGSDGGTTTDTSTSTTPTDTTTDTTTTDTGTTTTDTGTTTTPSSTDTGTSTTDTTTTDTTTTSTDTGTTTSPTG